MLYQSPWKAQVLVTSNDQHKLRIVIGYSSTNNRFIYLDDFTIPKINIFQGLSMYKVFFKLDLEFAYHPGIRKEIYRIRGRWRIVSI